MAKRSAVTIILIVVVSIILLVALNFLTAPVIDENAKASDKPGVTRAKQWIRLKRNTKNIRQKHCPRWSRIIWTE